jgi:phage baseplate assembly protein W
VKLDPREFLGRGWNFPFGVDPARGGVALSEFEENIRQNITIILGTKPGERQMLPGFGCRIHELLFAPNTRATGAMISHHVEEALARWEPRIQVLSVDAEPEQSGAVRVAVEYRVLATDAVQVVSLTMANR